MADVQFLSPSNLFLSIYCTWKKGKWAEKMRRKMESEQKEKIKIKKVTEGVTERESV